MNIIAKRSKQREKINKKENLIHNAFAKFEEANERIDALEKRVKMAKDKNMHLPSKLETVEETMSNSTIYCNLCDLILKVKVNLINTKKRNMQRMILKSKRKSSLLLSVKVMDQT